MDWGEARKCAKANKGRTSRPNDALRGTPEIRGYIARVLDGHHPRVAAAAVHALPDVAGGDELSERDALQVHTSDSQAAHRRWLRKSRGQARARAVDKQRAEREQREGRQIRRDMLCEQDVAEEGVSSRPRAHMRARRGANEGCDLRERGICPGEDVQMRDWTMREDGERGRGRKGREGSGIGHRTSKVPKGKTVGGGLCKTPMGSKSLFLAEQKPLAAARGIPPRTTGYHASYPAELHPRVYPIAYCPMPLPSRPLRPRPRSPSSRIVQSRICTSSPGQMPLSRRSHPSLAPRRALMCARGLELTPVDLGLIAMHMSTLTFLGDILFTEHVPAYLSALALLPLRTLLINRASPGLPARFSEPASVRSLGVACMDLERVAFTQLVTASYVWERVHSGGGDSRMVPVEDPPVHNVHQKYLPVRCTKWPPGTQINVTAACVQPSRPVAPCLRDFQDWEQELESGVLQCFNAALEDLVRFCGVTKELEMNDDSGAGCVIPGQTAPIHHPESAVDKGKQGKDKARSKVCSRYIICKAQSSWS
ncbi:hypothetical protein JB92DRAFT_3097240 [Gautieria morchelliformis]|nr:hypothetical protein JB92DRAFT_3097240 [Gautieria morchelliformis]